MEKLGKFIAIDGGEGSGKGSIVTHLIESLPRLYPNEAFVFTREPGGTPLSEKLRQMIFDNDMSTMAELLLFEAARAQHVADVIEPCTQRGANVISDRFDSSTFAYQVYARWGRKHEDLFHYVNSKVVTRAPDLYVFCDVSPDIGLKRRIDTGDTTRFDVESHAFHQQVYLGFKEFFAQPRSSRCTSVDASLSKAEVLAQIDEIMKREFSP